MGFIPFRYVFVAVSCLGIINLYTMRINLSVALIAMVNSTAVKLETNSSNECYSTYSNESTDHSTFEGEFIWDEYVQGIVLGSFFWGYIITQLPGARIAELYGAKWVFGIGVLCTSIFTLLTPLAAHEGYWYLAGIRALKGLGQGVTFPTMAYMISCWSPPQERSIISTSIFTGALIGTIIGMPLTGYLARYGFAGGWPSVFYIFGSSGIVWFVFWCIFAYESPEKHPWISEKEKKFILSSRENIGKNRVRPTKFPLKQVLRSVPVWAIITAHFCNNWGFYTLLTELPTYLANILDYDLKKSGLMSGIPYLTAWIFGIICSNICDYLIRQKFLSTTAARRIFNCIGQFLPAIFLFCLTFVGCNQKLAYTLLILAMTTNSAVFASFNCNHVDLAPNYAGTLFAISNSVATIPGWAGPYVVGALTQGKSNQHQWNVVFYITSSLYVFSGIFYALFAQGKEQPWNKRDYVQTESDNNEMENNHLKPLDVK